MNSKIFNALEIDAIGEILNISLGASATAVSTMLSKRVDITTPNVRVLSFDEFEFGDLEPAIAVEITYVSGLSGSNIMLLKRHDVKVIVETLMGMEIPDEEFELDEMNMSAVCEVMNQMMGSSSTALSEFLGELVNISTPISFEIEDQDAFKRKYFQSDEVMVVVNFTLTIEDTMKSEFLNVMPVHLAKRLVSAFGLDTEEEEIPETIEAPTPSTAGSGVMSQADIEAMLSQLDSSKEPEKPAVQESSSKTLSQEAIERLLQGSAPEPAPVQQPQMQMQQPQMQMQQPQMQQPQMQMQQPQMQQPQMQMQQPQMQMQQPQMQMQQPQMQMQPQMQQTYYVPQEPKIINVHSMVPQALQGVSATLGEEQSDNLALIMDVPLDVTVEIGRTKRLVKDILEFSTGYLVVLDKLAGEQVDLYVNGQCIAKGDVVVVDDNFGVRITEIIKKPDIRLGIKP